MLDTTTKRRIDTARDILVGKVPDPKSQVEQITIALIYKFMDDMDLDAEELGGEPSFFSGEYEKYGWRKIFNPSLGGFEMLSLYSEAILKMAQNPNLPQLFRDIFKNAYLPYRDPETLKSFLKIINDFSYDHSEKLGDAFEYLLSVLGSQGDAGQFRTPRHVIDFMTALIAPKKNETVLDPACGTAGFLISAYKHILKENSTNYDKTDPYTFEQNNVKLAEITVNGKHYKGDKLNPDDRARIIQNIKGYDISPDMVRLSLVNLYLHGFTDPHIYEYDTLTSEERWNEFYDIILANPPFMSPKGGIRPHKRFAVQSKRSEVLFVDYMAEHLTPTGKAAIIVPEGIIFQSGTAYKSLRKMLVEDNYLVGVISLPAGVFNPYSGVKTSILWLDKTLAKKTDKILFAKIENDGFDLGAQRRPIKQNDLPEVFRKLTEYRDKLMLGEDVDFENEALVSLVEKGKIAANPEYNLSGERYRDVLTVSKEFDLFELHELFEIQRGGSPRPIDEYITEDENGINWIKIGDVEEGAKFINSTKQKIKPEGLKKSRLVEPGDFILSNSMSFGRPYIVNIKGAIHDGWLVFKQKKENLLKDYILYILSSQPVKQQFEQSATGGVVKNLNINLVKKVQIPLPPLSVQEEIVAEIESYQKIIDGAKAVVANYKPKIDIDPDWEMVELGEIIKLSSGKGLTSANMIEGPYPVYGGNGINGHHNEYFLEEPTIVIGRIGAYCGAVHITEPKSWITDNGLYVTSFLKEIELGYLSQLLTQLNLNRYAKVGGQPSISQKTVTELSIAVPSIETQRKIVAQIEKEQALVNANNQLIEIFEQKIKDRIAKVWGE